MSEFQYKAGLNNVGSYQVSGVPFLTGALTVPTSSGTPLEISFPTVTKYFEIINLGSVDIKVGFSSNGIKGTNSYIVAHAQNNQQNTNNNNKRTTNKHKQARQPHSKALMARPQKNQATNTTKCR